MLANSVTSIAKSLTRGLQGLTKIPADGVLAVLLSVSFVATALDCHIARTWRLLSNFEGPAPRIFAYHEQKFVNFDKYH